MKASKFDKLQKHPLNVLEAEIAIAALHATGDFTVLRKLKLDGDTRFTQRQVPDSRIAICLDTETTGLNHAEDKVIELGMVAFEYDPASGEILRITGRYNGFEDPKRPLAAEITEITGISDEMVAGQAFDDDQIRELCDTANLVIAHNAAFDRKFVEQRFPHFTKMPWACTVAQIDWSKERISSRTLEYLLYKCGGYSIKAHRALDDAEGVLGLLVAELPLAGTSIFKKLLERSGEVTSKIYAVGAPFAKKDILKQRGYRWNDGADNGCKGWWVDVPQQLEKDEMSYLAREIYPGGTTKGVEINRVDALARFSVREG